MQAKLWQHQNGYWYVLHGPRLRQQLSTKTKDSREAKAFLARFSAVAEEPSSDSPTMGEILEAYRLYKVATTDEDKALVAELRQLQKLSGAPMGADDKARLDELLVQVGHKVRSAGSLEYSIKGLEPLAPLYPTQITPAGMKKWAMERGASAGTILRDVGVARAALAHAKASQWDIIVPDIGNPVPVPDGRTRWLDRDEGRKLITGAVEPHIRVFIVMGLGTLARTGAILEARWPQVNWARRYIDYGRGHGNKRRTIVPLNDEVFAILEAAYRLAATDHIVEWRGDSVTSVKNGFAAARERAGLGPDVTPHILRHSGASWLVEDGLSDEEVARMLGDTVEMVRRVYGHFRPEYLARASSALKLGKAPAKAP